jgi:hypothetical protein
MGDNNEDSSSSSNIDSSSSSSNNSTSSGERTLCRPDNQRAVRSVGCHLRHKTTTIRRLGHSKQQRVVESSASATATNGCRGRDKYHCANVANDGRGNKKRRPWQQKTTAVATTNDGRGNKRNGTPSASAVVDQTSNHTCSRKVAK